MAKKKAPPVRGVTKNAKNAKNAPARSAKMAKANMAPRLVGGRKGPAKRATPAKRPKTPPLPGMENKSKLSRELLEIMDVMADQLHIMNEASATLKGLRNNALNQMKRDGVMVAKEHGIELLRVPGEEKIRARLVSGEGATDHEGDAGSDDVDDDNLDDDGLDNGEGDGSVDVGDGEEANG